MSVEQPFSARYSQRLFLLTDRHREALARLDEGLGAREPFVLITGEPGIGKTTLVLEAIARWGSRVVAASVTNPALTRTELIEEIARRFGANPTSGASKPQLLACLDSVLAERTGRDRVAMLVIEDAHDLEPDLFEELRLVANAQAQAGRRLEIVLVGLPALDATLAHPALAAVRQRVAVHCRLSPLTQRETRNYLHHRVNAVGGEGPRLFPRKTCSEIQSLAVGVPRAINALASEALRRARETGAIAVTPDHVRAAAAVVRNAVPTVPAIAPGSPATPPETPPEVDIEQDAALRDTDVATGPVRTGAEVRGSVESRPASNGPAPGAPIGAPTTANPEAAPEPGPQPEPVARAGNSAPPSPEVAGERSTDPRAREWVKRFIGDQGPPRIGARVGWDASALGYSAEIADPAALDETELETVFQPPAPVVAPPPPPRSKRASERRGRSSGPLPPLDRDRRSSSAMPSPEPRPEPSRSDPAPAIPSAPSASAPAQAWGPLHTAAVVLMVLAALAVLILPRARLASRPTVSPSGVKDARSPTGIASITPSAPQVELGPVETNRADSSRGAPTDIAAASGSTGVEVPVEADTTVVQKFALDVATFIDRGRATDERERLAGLAGLRGWVTSGDAGHHVLLGTFSTRARAETAANALLERGILWQARVVALPPRRRAVE